MINKTILTNLINCGRKPLTIAGLALFGIAAHAQDLSISAVWCLASPPASKNGAVYLRVDNASSQADMLMGAETGVAKSIDLHSTMHMNGHMKMHRHNSFAIPAKGSLELAPGGRHIMLMGLVEPLEAGQKFALNLKFMNAGEVETEVEVLENPPSN